MVLDPPDEVDGEVAYLGSFAAAAGAVDPSIAASIIPADIAAAATEAVISLRKLGVVDGVVTYDGYGASGQLAAIEYLHRNASADRPEIAHEINQALEDYCEALLPGGWEINSGSRGEIRIDVAAGTAELNHAWLEEVYDGEDTDEARENSENWESVVGDSVTSLFVITESAEAAAAAEFAEFAEDRPAPAPRVTGGRLPPVSHISWRGEWPQHAKRDIDDLLPVLAKGRYTLTHNTAGWYFRDPDFGPDEAISANSVTALIAGIRGYIYGRAAQT